jgi:hypothetical protein
MHRILLFALVLGLVYFSWRARSDTVHAAFENQAAHQPRLNGQPAADADAKLQPALATRGQALQHRLEARIDSDEATWEGIGPDLAQGELSDMDETSLHALLGQSEPSQDPSNAALVFALDTAGVISRHARRKHAKLDEPETEAPEREPLYVVSLARVESLNSNLPPWSGLLDLALDPGAVLEGGIRMRAGTRAELVDTAWLSDEQGVFLARVEALDGLGLILDPSWPLFPQARRLSWTAEGGAGLGARQFRIVLYGPTAGTSWTGRLVLIPMPRTSSATGR